MNKTYGDLCDELELAHRRLDEQARRIQQLEAEGQAAVSKARRELVNMIEGQPARHQAEQARQRLEFDQQCRQSKREVMS